MTAPQTSETVKCSHAIAGDTMSNTQSIANSTTPPSFNSHPCQPAMGTLTSSLQAYHCALEVTARWGPATSNRGQPGW